eukprot:319927_1
MSSTSEQLLESDKKQQLYFSIEQKEQDNSELCNHDAIEELCLKFKDKTIEEAVNAVKHEYGDHLCTQIIIDLMSHNANITFNPMPKSEYPRLFIPSITTLTDDTIKWSKDVIKHSLRNFKIRLIRSSLLISVPIIFLIVATYSCFNLANAIGICLLCLFIGYFMIILIYVLSVGCNNCLSSHNDALYRIYSYNKTPNKWAAVKVSYVNILYTNSSVRSISELSAINGTVTKLMLNGLGAFVWTAIIVFFAAELYYNRSGFKWDWSDLSAFIGTIGLLLISKFELDPYCVYMIIFHYIGAALGSGTIIAYILQQNSFGENMMGPICIGIVSGISFVAWQLIGVATDIAQRDAESREMNFFCHCLERCVLCFRNERKLKRISVNTYSKLNICSEAVFLFGGALSLSFWLMEYEREGCIADNLIGCSDPFPCTLD